MKKKSYNPFKMWGSWAGAILISIIPLPFCWLSECIFISYGRIYFVNLPNSLILGVILTGIGFLIGWGIHSLVRKLRK